MSAGDGVAKAASSEILFDDQEMRITRRRGQGSCSVVSFSGIGLKTLDCLEEVQQEEFGRSAAQAGDATLIFVIDKTRSWYNAVHERVTVMLARELRDVPAVCAIGNSMGGYAALRFASALPNCVRAIAFSPQYAVHPDHMPTLEKRWWRHRDAIAHHHLGHALETASDSVDYWIFGGAGHLSDVAHLRAFRRLRLPNVGIVCLDQSGHDAALAIRQAGALGEVLHEIMPPGAARRDTVLSILAGHGVSTVQVEVAEVRLPDRGKPRPSDGKPEIGSLQS